ncbi:YbhN family protein [Halobium salinum]|uniref:YbhN family protein n=1 Tax=Halobium salinum TaxID=1364940 RepID=A0ABD5PF78_9EURY|nr:lysylphosphatidylglycerol synthase transmembrane domain-containing protein [Halobium salinum]
MAGRRLRTTVLGFLATFLVFGALFTFVGVDDLVATLSSADTGVVALVVFVTVCWLAAWSMALKVVLGVLGVDVPPHRAFLIFAGAMFSNNVTPFGQAGGEPVTALLISRVADAEYETGLAAIASVDTLNFVPSISLALVGVGYFATETTLGRRLEVAAAAVVVLALLVPGLVYYGWRNRYGLEERAVARFTPAIRWVADKLPRTTPPSEAVVEERITGFFRSIERVATNRRGLALSLGFSALGWGLQMVGLWLAFRAIGHSIPLSIALFVVPIGAIAGVTPLPGGAGGIETVLVTLLALATGPVIGLEVATAAVVIYRGAVYWVPVLVGGAVMSVLTVRSRA